MMESITRINRNPAITHPCSTAVPTLKHSELYPPSDTQHCVFVYRSLIIRMNLFGIHTTSVMIFLLLSRCMLAKALLKSTKFKYKEVCYSTAYPIMFLRTKACPLVLLPLRAIFFTPILRWRTVTAHLLFVKSYHRAIDGC